MPGCANQIVETGAVAAFTQTAQRDKLRAAAVDTTLRTVVVVDDAGALDAFVAGYTAAPPVAVTGDAVAHLAYTGGTTGVSKGVRVLHRNVIANVTQMIAWRAGHAVVADGDLVRLERRDGGGTRGVEPGAGATVVVSPLYHAHALINMSFLLLCGATQVLAGAIRPNQ